MINAGDLVKAILCRGPECPQWRVEAVEGNEVLLRHHSGSRIDVLQYGWTNCEEYTVIRRASDF
ncbi:MAG: hypothetical protein AAFV72_21285 [Cyanobacteria bacterium J06635_1]